MSLIEIFIYYITVCIVTILLMKTYEKYSETKITFNKKTNIKILMFSIIYLINNLFMINSIKALMSTIICYLFLKWIYKEKSSKIIYYTITFIFILCVVEIIVSLFLPIGIIDIESLNNNVIFKVIFSIVVDSIFYFILTHKFIVYILKRFEKFVLSKKVFYLVGTIIVIIVNFWLFYSGFNTSDKYLNLILGITEIIIFISMILFIKNNYEKHILEIKETQLKQDLELYSKVASEYKELKHNLMNDFLIIKSKLPKKEQPFINEVINKYKSNYEWVNSVTDIPEGLQGLVFLKKNQAELKNIHFNLEYNVNKKNENIFEINNNFKLYETLGILFDNAIEGASESKEKIINVVFSCEKTSFIINIMNTFSNDIDLDKIGNKDYSTKNRGSGIGLNYIKKQKNKFKIKQTIINNVFTTEIIINQKEKNPKKKSR